jgi:NADH dehydrogenase (ubiquinone) 1 beta subcomplex subunit 7
MLVVRANLVFGVIRLLRSVSSRLLIPLNICRKEKLYLPWECTDERHSYEKFVFTFYIPSSLLRVNWVALDASMMSESKSALAEHWSQPALATCGV